MSEVVRFTGQGNCDTHGVYNYQAYRNGSTVFGATCPKCRERNQSQAYEINRRKEAERNKQARLAKLMNAGIPVAFFDASFATYNPTTENCIKMLRILAQYTDNFDSILSRRTTDGLIFTGVPGTGKTHLACAMCAKLISAGYAAAYLSAPQFLLRAREAAFNRSEDRASVLIDRYSKPHFLVIDEFGAHTTQDTDYQILYAVVDSRYQRNLPTLLITNIRQSDLKDKIDPRFMERVRGMNGPLFAFDWPTHRRRPAIA